MTSCDRVIPFVKANACGNDFLIVDRFEVPGDIQDFSRRLCDRRHGVGADGVEWLFPAPDAHVQARLFNADGSEAEISGNGTSVTPYCSGCFPTGECTVHAKR